MKDFGALGAKTDFFKRLEGHRFLGPIFPAI
jgi:hypothetical protein